MLTAEKQVRRVFGCTITQERHSQLHLILLLWHPPAQWDIVTLNPSVFFKAWQAHSSQDSWDILVPVCKHPPDLKIPLNHTKTKEGYHADLSQNSVDFNFI